MIPELGHAALWLAAAFALGGALLPRLQGRAELAAAFAAPAVTAHALLMLAALLALGWAFAADDFSVSLVNDFSHTSRAPLAKLAATWGTLPGALLLWLTSLGLAATVYATVSADTPLRARTLLLLALVAGFGSAVLLALTPFARADLAAIEGRAGMPLLGTSYDMARLLFAAGVLGVPAALMVARRGDPAAREAARPWLWLASGLLGIAAAFAAWGAASRHGGAAVWLRDAAPVALPWLGVTALAWRGDHSRALRLGPIIVATGLVTAAAGIALAHGFGAEARLAAAPGATARLGGKMVRVAGVRPVAGSSFTAVEARLVGDATLRPQLRVTQVPDRSVRQTATKGTARGDLHARFDGRQVLLAWRPLAWLIWTGCGLAALGAFASILLRRAG